MNKYTLIIIDMQADFGSSEHPALNTNIKIRIRKAMKAGMHIVFVRYIGSGKILDGLLELTKGYRKKHFVSKKHDDGSNELYSFFHKHPRITRSNLVICGVNTNCCVRYTIKGLVEKSSRVKVKIPVNCCNTDCFGSGPYKYFHSLAEVIAAKSTPFYNFVEPSEQIELV